MGLDRDEFYIVDIEGNGAQPPEIVELAITPIVDLQLGSRRWEWRVQPQQAITPMASRIHGITNDDVAEAPTIDDIAGDIMTWTDGRKIVGHNVKVELEAISRAIPDWKPCMAVDTLRLAKSVRPGLASYSLENLGKELGLSSEASRLTGKEHHSASFDTVLTALLFIDLIASLPEQARADAIADADVFNGRQGILL